MEKQLLQSRISIMLSQIQPHFPYNSLTAIRQLCDIDPPKAKQAVTLFSRYLRGNTELLTTCLLYTSRAAKRASVPKCFINGETFRLFMQQK